jgi:hypothetical protein
MDERRSKILDFKGTKLGRRNVISDMRTKAPGNGAFARETRIEKANQRRVEVKLYRAPTPLNCPQSSSMMISGIDLSSGRTIHRAWSLNYRRVTDRFQLIMGCRFIWSQRWLSD